MNFTQPLQQRVRGARAAPADASAWLPNITNDYTNNTTTI